MRICWLFGLPSTQKLCTNQPHVPCPCSNLSACCDPFSSKTLSVKSQATNDKKSHLLHLLLFIYIICQDDHNTMPRASIEHKYVLEMLPCSFWKNTFESQKSVRSNFWDKLYMLKSPIHPTNPRTATSTRGTWPPAFSSITFWARISACERGYLILHARSHSRR